jgi:hypothetical protein
MSIAFKIIKRLIIALFSLVIAGVIALLLWRVVSSGNPKELEVISANDRISEAYGEGNEDLYMFKQNQSSITSADYNYGYFSITDYVIIPDANQIQTLFRYKTSALERTAERYSLDSVPARDSEAYEVTLVIAVDLTPDNTEDNKGNAEGSVGFIRCRGEVVQTGKKNMYNYRRLVFQLDDADVDINQLMDNGLLLAIYADICYIDAINYDEPYGTLCLYDYLSPNVRVKLEKKDIKALEAYSQKGE